MLSGRVLYLTQEWIDMAQKACGLLDMRLITMTFRSLK